MRLLLALALSVSCAASVRAQYNEPSPHTAARLGETVVLAYGGMMGAGVGAGAAGLVVAGTEMPTGAAVPVVLAGAAVGLAGGVHGAGTVLGVDGSFRNALGDAGAGVAVGALAGAGTVLFLDAVVPEPEREPCGFSCPFVDFGALERDLGIAAAGAFVAVAVPLVWVVSDYRDVPVPVAIPTPDGEAAPGLALAVRL